MRESDGNRDLMMAMADRRPTSGHSPRVRTRRPLDLSDPGVLESVGKEQIAYYRARASWYDDVYECVGE